jgi:MFS family permease
VPYIIRAIILSVTFIVAFFTMKDLGFSPKRSSSILKDMKKLLSTSFDLGLRKPSVRWIMLEAPFTMGVGVYAFYAMQPYLLELYGDPNSYSIAGLAAAIVAGSQIIGGLVVPKIRKLLKRRTSFLLFTVIVNCLLLVALSQSQSFAVAIMLLVVWGLLFSSRMPIRQAYLNELIPSRQRATVLSFDSLMGSSGGVVVQPTLGKVADVSGYSTSYMVGAAFQIISLPFILLARRGNKR